MNRTLEDMARTLVESGGYRIIRRLGPQTEYHPPDNTAKLIGAIVDVETTGTDIARDKIIELGMCLFEYGQQDKRIYRVLGAWLIPQLHRGLLPTLSQPPQKHDPSARWRCRVGGQGGEAAKERTLGGGGLALAARG